MCVIMQALNVLVYMQGGHDNSDFPEAYLDDRAPTIEDVPDLPIATRLFAVRHC